MNDINQLERESVVAAIGNFDGVHRGHQLLLRETIAFAAALGVDPAVIVFRPHPRRYFTPDAPPFRLTSDETRASLIRSFGVPNILTLAFNADLAIKTPSAFVSDILKKKFSLAGVLTGADFRFGVKRSGDVKMLEQLCLEQGIASRIVEPLSPPGEGKFGSTEVRNAIIQGDMRRAAEILGRYWRVEGSVLRGRELGRTIGFPTANLSLGELIAPRHGVYAVRVVIGQDVFDGIANFGTRPTVDGGPPLLEVNIFKFVDDLYGRCIAVDFVDFIRDEKKFDGIDALKMQIAKDCEIALKILDAG